MAAAGDDLVRFVREALSRGTGRGEIEGILVKAGWAAPQIRSALDSFADLEYPVPIPRPRAYFSARDAFVFLLLFTTLYISAFNLGALVFQFIDDQFPDPAASAMAASYRLYALRWAASCLIVAFPVFLWVSAVANRAVKADEGKRGSAVRRWLTYLTLFVAAGVLIGDVICLVYNLLGGELTTPFVLKVTTVAAIAGTAFTYYLRDERTARS